MAAANEPLIKIRLGKKATKGSIDLGIVAPLREVVEKLQALPKDISIKYQMKALRKAAKPGMDALRTNYSQLGEVTGNLRASVAKAERKYTNNKQRIPVSVIVVGPRRPTNSKSQKSATPAFNGGTVLKGPNRAYHSHLIEFGTKPRTPGFKTRSRRRGRVLLGGRIRTQRENFLERSANKSGILSSFSSRGPFKSKGRGRYPTDFIATGPVRGIQAYKPLQRAFTSSRSQMQSILDTEMRKALSKAQQEYAKSLKDLGP
jgi:hypothetical protein